MAIISSNYSLSFSSQRQIEDLQKELADRQKEISTGRKSDLALNLGYQIRHAIDIHSLSNTLDTYLSNNRIVGAKLEATQSALTNISMNADEFKSMLIQSQNDRSGQKIIVTQASNFLNLFISSLNTTFENRYIFGGEKTNIPPVNDYSAEPISPAKTAIDTAFSLAPPPDLVFPKHHLLYHLLPRPKSIIS